jgi:hypothetical protein
MTKEEEMLTKTPRTDAELEKPRDGVYSSFFQMASHARQLERELNSVRDAREKMAKWYEEYIERLHKYTKRVLIFMDSDLPTRGTKELWDEYETKYGKVEL